MKPYSFLPYILTILPTIITPGNSTSSQQRRVAPSLCKYSTTPKPHDTDTDDKFFFPQSTYRRNKTISHRAFENLEKFLKPFKIKIIPEEKTLIITEDEQTRILKALSKQKKLKR